MESISRHSKELSEKIVEGLRRSSQKLLEQRAAENGTLVVLVDGKPCDVPARELLKKKKMG